MRVYDFKGFPNPARVRIALAEKGMLDDVDFTPVNVPEGAHKAEEFKAKNPSATVPVLELDDGTTLSECSAIIEYLDALKDQGQLNGSSAKDRGVIAMRQRLVEANFLDAIAAYFHLATDGLGPAIEDIQNREWGEIRRAAAVSFLDRMESFLQDGQYLAGDAFTNVDITAYAGHLFADFVGLTYSAETYPRLAAWRQRVEARPAVQQALA